MASRYIPPHLRNKAQHDSQDDLSTATNPIMKSTEALARRRLSDLKLSDSDRRPLHTIEELNSHYGSTLIHSTLRDSTAQPGQLGFVVLFKHANPRWKLDRILFAHTNINILPGYAEYKQKLDAESAVALNAGDPLEEAEEDNYGEREVLREDTVTGLAKNDPIQPSATSATQNTTTKETTPSDTAEPSNKTNTIPIFMEIPSIRGSRNLEFHGYFQLTNTDYLKPHSPELVRMLKQKWEPAPRHPNAPPPVRVRHRDPEAWAKSLAQEWAVVKFEAVPGDECPEDPKIEVLPEREESVV